MFDFFHQDQIKKKLSNFREFNYYQIQCKTSKILFYIIFLGKNLYYCNKHCFPGKKSQLL